MRMAMLIHFNGKSVIASYSIHTYSVIASYSIHTYSVIASYSIHTYSVIASYSIHTYSVIASYSIQTSTYTHVLMLRYWHTHIHTYTNAHSLRDSAHRQRLHASQRRSDSRWCVELGKYVCVLHSMSMYVCCTRWVCMCVALGKYVCVLHLVSMYVCYTR